MCSRKKKASKILEKILLDGLCDGLTVGARLGEFEGLCVGLNVGEAKKQTLDSIIPWETGKSANKLLR